MLTEMILDRVHVGIAVVDSTNHIFFCNQCLSEMSGKNKPEMIGFPLEEIFPRFAEPRYRQILHDAICLGHSRLCSGLMHQPFVLSPDQQKNESLRQNLEVHPLQMDGNAYALLQFTDISSQYFRIFQLKQLIKDLETEFSEAKAAQEIMQKRSTQDSLTGVLNRWAFMEQLTHSIALASRSKEMLGMLFLDLDGFKAVNDSMGHGFGDKVLAEVAHRLKSMIRVSDTMGRLGGDEFGIIATNIKCKEDLAVFVQKLLDGFDRPFIIGDVPLSIGVSIGVSLYPDDGDTPQTLVHLSDMAMYAAKNSDSTHVMFYPGT